MITSSQRYVTSRYAKKESVWLIFVTIIHLEVNKALIKYLFSLSEWFTFSIFEKWGLRESLDHLPLLKKESFLGNTSYFLLHSSFLFNVLKETENN